MGSTEEDDVPFDDDIVLVQRQPPPHVEGALKVSLWPSVIEPGAEVVCDRCQKGKASFRFIDAELAKEFPHGACIDCLDAIQGTRTVTKSATKT